MTGVPNTRAASPAVAVPPTAARPAGPYRPWITAAGVYDDIPDDEYHADPVVGGSLSSSGAGELLRPGGPQRFAWTREHGRPPKTHFDLGRAVHTEALGVGAPILVVQCKDRRGKVWEQGEAEARKAGMTPLPEPTAAKVFAMADALRAHSVVGKMLARPGRAERTVVGRDPDTGILCRCRIDWWPDVDDDARIVIGDLKTTGHQDGAAPREFAKSVGNYGYHRQAPFYGDILDWVGLAPNGWRFVMITIETDPPYLISTSWVDDEAIEWGRRLNRRARWLYRWCTTTGQWPGYTSEPVELSLPSWLLRRYESDYDAGRFDVDDLIIDGDSQHDPIGERP